AELRGVNRYVNLHVAELEGISAIQPGERVFERELDAVDVAIVGVVHLCRNAADGGRAVAHYTHQQSSLGVEVERREEAARAAALHHLHFFIADAIERANAPTAERCLDLPGERQQRIEPGAVEFASGQVVGREQTARGFDPTGAAVVGAGAVAALRVIFEGDLRGALIRGLRENLKRTAAAEAFVA